jgi:hypothetical protein
MHKAFVILLFVFINQSCFGQQIKRYAQSTRANYINLCSIEEFKFIDKQIELGLDSMEKLIPLNYDYLFNPYCYSVEFIKRLGNYFVVIKRISGRDDFDVISNTKGAFYFGYAKWRNTIVIFYKGINWDAPKSCCGNLIKELVYYHLPFEEQHEIDIDNEIHIVSTSKNSIRRFPIDITKE